MLSKHSEEKVPSLASAIRALPKNTPRKEVAEKLAPVYGEVNLDYISTCRYIGTKFKPKKSAKPKAKAKATKKETPVMTVKTKVVPERSNPLIRYTDLVALSALIKKLGKPTVQLLLDTLV